MMQISFTVFEYNERWLWTWNEHTGMWHATYYDGRSTTLLPKFDRPNVAGVNYLIAGMSQGVQKTYVKPLRPEASA